MPFSFRPRAELLSSEVFNFCFFAGGRLLVDSSLSESELESELDSELLELSSEDDEDDWVEAAWTFLFVWSCDDFCFDDFCFSPALR